MTNSQDEVRRALDEIPGLVSFKPGDRDLNWKPCDYMVWWQNAELELAESAWIEVKQTRYKSKWCWMGTGDAQLRPAQIRGMQRAHDISLPYIVALYWASRRCWTLHWLRPDFPLVVTFEEACSRYGVLAAPASLGLVLRGVLNGEAGL